MLFSRHKRHPLILDHYDTGCVLKRSQFILKKLIEKEELRIQFGDSTDPGLSVHARDENGWTLLHHAVHRKQLEFVKYLIEKHAAPNAVTNHSWWPKRLNELEHTISLEAYWLTPLHLAVEYATPELVEYLINHGANPNCQDSLKRKPIDICIIAIAPVDDDDLIRKRYYGEEGDRIRHIRDLLLKHSESSSKKKKKNKKNKKNRLN